LVVTKETEIGIAEELLDLTGVLIPARGYDNITLDSCLCQVDVKATLNKAGFAYKHDVLDMYWLTDFFTEEEMPYQGEEFPDVFTPLPPDAPYLPSGNYSLPVHQQQYEWENYSFDFFNKQTDSERTIEKIEIINKVALDLIENSVDLEPEIVSFIDEEFWNLI